MRRLVEVPPPTLQPRITWIEGTLRPLESLLHVVHRIRQLNPLLATSPFVRAVCPSISPQRVAVSSSLSKNKASRVLEYEAISLEALAQLLHEPVAALKYSHQGCFNGWAAELFGSRVRICPICASWGFHSVLYSLSFLRTCPIHSHTELLQGCSCGRLFPDDLSSALCLPGRCACGKQFFFTFPSFAFQSPVREEMLSPLTAIAEWLFIVGERIATGAVADQCVAEWLDPEVVARHAWHWADRLGDSRIGSVPWASSNSDDLFEQERSTVCPVIFEPKHRRHANPKFVSLDFSEGQYNPYAARLRRLRRTHPKATKWLQEVSSYPDAVLIQRGLSSSRTALFAFAMALWGMHLETDFDLRRWWQGSHRRISSAGWQQAQKRFSLGPRSLAINPEECRWIERKIEEAELELIWQCASAMAQKLGRCYMYMGKDATLDLLGTNRRVSWTACRRPDGRLEVVTTLPTGFEIRLEGRRHLNKSERCDAWNKVEIPRRQALLKELSTRVLVQELDGQWRVEEGHLPRIDPRGPWCRKHRIKIDGKWYRAITFRTDGRITIGRGLDIPVEVCSTDSTENVIDRLKSMMATITKKSKPSGKRNGVDMLLGQ